MLGFMRIAGQLRYLLAMQSTLRSIIIDLNVWMVRHVVVRELALIYYILFTTCIRLFKGIDAMIKQGKIWWTVLEMTVLQLRHWWSGTGQALMVRIAWPRGSAEIVLGDQRFSWSCTAPTHWSNYPKHKRRRWGCEGRSGLNPRPVFSLQMFGKVPHVQAKEWLPLRESKM